MYFKSNIKLLRKRAGRTQDDVSFTLDMKRSTLSGYENGVAQPNMETLATFDGNQSSAARHLGLTESGLRYKLSKWKD